MISVGIKRMTHFVLLLFLTGVFANAAGVDQSEIDTLKTLYAETGGSN
jgi:hypothetical protein